MYNSKIFGCKRYNLAKMEVLEVVYLCRSTPPAIRNFSRN